MRLLSFILAFLTISPLAIGQSQELELPRQSPGASVSQRIALTDITINYHRPAVKDRTVWGELVPYNTGQPIPWRAGANENTTIQFTTDVAIEGEHLAAGTYGLHMIPSEKEVIVIFSKDYQSWGSFSYNPNQDALRVTVTPVESTFHEWLTYSFTPTSSTSVTCQLQWGDRAIPFEISVDRETVLASIREELKNEPGWTWRGWNEAANYCLQQNFNYQEGLGWAGRSVWAQPNFQNIKVKAELMALQQELEGDAYNAFVLDQIEKDMSSEPVDWNTWNNAAAYALNTHKNHDKAMAWADASLEQFPTFANTNTKADILTAMGKEKQAQKLMDKMLANGSNFELNKYAYKLLYSGKGKEAIEVFVLNTEKHPDDPNVWDSLGEGYYRTGDYENAEKYLRKCLSMDPQPLLANHAKGLLKAMGVEDLPN